MIFSKYSDPHLSGVKQKSPHQTVLRVSGLGVAGILATLMVTAVAPPIVADESDRAVLDAPVTLLTAPVGGEVSTAVLDIGQPVSPGQRVAEILNPRIDRTTLISLEQKFSEAREKLAAAQSKQEVDQAYLAALDSEIDGQTQHLRAQLRSQIEELRARVAQSGALSSEKKALVDRQSEMVARNAASSDMVKPTQQQYTAALRNTDAEEAKLSQKLSQFDALNKGIYVGEELVAINILAQKRRDIELDAKSMEIEARQQTGVVANLKTLVDAERNRVKELAVASVISPVSGNIFTVGAAVGRHVNAGDTVASIADCEKRFVVAIFSYRQGEKLKPGTRVRIDGAPFKAGIIKAVLAKTSDKVDERFAVPFPQTERRELYAIIEPDPAEPAAKSTAGVPGCALGQWVTVSLSNSVIPSMSITWRRIETFVAGLSGAEHSATQAEWSEATARLKVAMLHAPSQRQTTDEEGVGRSQIDAAP